jgi:hypothetical protein
LSQANKQEQLDMSATQQTMIVNDQQQQSDQQVNPVQSSHQLNPTQLLEIAITKGIDNEQLKALMQLQRDWENDQATKAYHMAVAEFKRNPVVVIKDRLNKQYGSMYVSRGHLVNTVNQQLGKYGLNARWEMQQLDNLIKVTCILSHELGHSERASMTAPPDDSGKKNPIQQIKSTKTYLEVATYESVTGVAATDAGDDDGNAACAQSATITAQQVMDIEALSKEVNANMALFLEYFRIDQLENMTAANYQRAIQALESKR